MSITPLHLEIIVHYYINNGPFRTDNDTIQDYRQYWINEGCLERCGDPEDPDEFEVTLKGEAWIEKVLSTPMPTQKWVWED